MVGFYMIKSGSCSTEFLHNVQKFASWDNRMWISDFGVY
ncbi:unnamed protein product [Lathyrus oleraceus]